MNKSSTPGSAPPQTVLDDLPKAELHLHLEGSIRPQTAVALAARHGESISAAEVVKRYSYANFDGFIAAFKWVTSYLRDPEDYALIARDLAEELMRQKVVYAEFTVSAGVMLRRMQNVEANVGAVRETLDGVLFRRLRVGLILDCVRQFGAEAAMETARWASRLQHQGVVAFGMGGDELALPTANFRSVFDFARGEGLRAVCHAGEIGGPENVREAVELLGAERVGHGIAVMHDPALAEWLIARRVVLENCLTSNLCTNALAKQTGKSGATLADHPLPAFLKSGLAVTLSTDDPSMFHTDLLTEYANAASLGLTQPQLLNLAEQSFNAAFLPVIEKRALLEEFRAAAKSRGLL